MDRMQQIERKFMKAQAPDFRIGDTVDVHVKIVEEVLDADAGKKQIGKKKKSSEKRERIQIYSGVVIADKHDGLRRTFTVRRIVQGEGVERIFPVHSPVVAAIKVRRSSKVRRAKLYYLRDLYGRAARLNEKKALRQFSELVPTGSPAHPEAAPIAPAPENPPASQQQAGSPSPKEQVLKS